jgi:hypothetical protein
VKGTKLHVQPELASAAETEAEPLGPGVIGI